MIPPPKFSVPKFLTYKGTKTLMTHVIHFKIAMNTISMPKDKKEPCFASYLLLPSRKWCNNGSLNYPLRV